MGKRDTRKRRQKRRERQLVDTEQRDRERRAAKSTPMENRSLCFRARGGVEFQLPAMAQPVQGTGEALTPDEARARLVEHAFGVRPIYA